MKYLSAVRTLVFVCASATASAPPLPGDSIYQLKVALMAQNGTQIRLDELRGRPVLIAMFYASCDGVCPAIAFNMGRMEKALTPAQRQALRLVMVSFDPAHDDSTELAKFARDNKLDDGRWIVARTPESSVRELAAALGVRYRELPGGVFSHSTVIAVLDADGVMRAHTSSLSELDPEFMRVLSATTSTVPVQPSPRS